MTKHDAAPTDAAPTDGAPDSSDVIEGPIGGAALKDPNRPEQTGADLDALPTIDPPTADDVLAD
jgi:hypothetical protein